MTFRETVFSFLPAIVLLLSGCSSQQARAPVDSRDVRSPEVVKREAKASPEATYHTVRRGDTLYSIAWEYGHTYQELARWNGIRKPYTIYAGQRLRVAPSPSTSGRSDTPRAGGSAAGARPAARPQTKVATTHPAPAHVPRAVPSAMPSAMPAPPVAKPAPPVARPAPVLPVAKPVPAPGNARVESWLWPTEGPVLRTFQSQSAGRKGVDIGGRAGQRVVAAADGRVVYTGSGLVGYGRLIIVKHNKNMLSAYGHNQKIMVKEGDQVRGGQAIATMGNSGTTRNQLYFEIRKDGKPVNPLLYLPKR